MEQKLQQISGDFLTRIEPNLPVEKTERSFVVAMIGLIGSGRTTVAKMLAVKIRGVVLIQSNSARYLLKEAGMSWGENVRWVLKVVAKDLLARGYSVVFDVNAADEKDRKNIEEIASASGAKVLYVRINLNPEIAKSREKAKYDNPRWVSSFDNFQVNSTEKMLENIDQRAELHTELKPSNIPDLVGEIDNNGSLADLEQQVQKIANKIKEG